MTTVTNISGGLLVCNLKDGSTLRLGNKKSGTFKDEVITDHVRHLASKGKVILRDKKASKLATTSKRKEKKEVKNGNV